MSGPVLVTGASGFVGRALVERMCRERVVVATSRDRAQVAADAKWVPSPDFELGTLGLPLGEVGAVVHLAAIAHVPAGASDRARRRVMRVNAEAPVEFARRAAAAGVRRFVFLSSVKALGERSSAPLRPDAPAAPEDLYGEAKLAAERGLTAVARDTGLEVVIVRAPLVYGPGVKANFAQLVRWVACGRPLPLGAARNRRSLVSVWNLVDALALCCDSPAAAGGAWHVTDGRSLSTRELVEAIGRAAGVRPRLWDVPPSLVRAALALCGRGAMARRLFDSLELDDSATLAQLSWRPPTSVDDALARTVRSLA
ncbi:MAG: NAD-dependent epimerase/dehydratase family protein [Steroidobacteraceae bacterium]|nr:NAD-dependent epimerase/dehydratase family protein [Steroidobacteraceae bacterium]